MEKCDYIVNDLAGWNDCSRQACEGKNKDVYDDDNHDYYDYDDDEKDNYFLPPMTAMV